MWSVSYENDLSHWAIISVEMRFKNKWRKYLEYTNTYENQQNDIQDGGKDFEVVVHFPAIMTVFLKKAIYSY